MKDDKSYQSFILNNILLSFAIDLRIYKDDRRNQLPPRGEVGRHDDPDRSPDEMAVADSTLAMPLQGMRGRSQEGVSVLPVAKTKRRVSCADPSREDAEENKTERKVI